MSRRSLVVALALVLAFAAVAPTLAQDQAQIGVVAKTNFVKKTAKKAKRIARQARSLARGADRRATVAKNRASKARRDAAHAINLANSAETHLADRTASRESMAGTVETGEENDYVSLGGPQVTVKVPQSGLVEVWAQVTIEPEGAVSLYEDGDQMAGQDPDGICDGPPGALLSQAADQRFTVATPSGTQFAFCGNSGPPGPVLFSTTPGVHTYELRYADCPCTTDPAEFSDRMLTVAPRP